MTELLRDVAYRTLCAFVYGSEPDCSYSPEYALWFLLNQYFCFEML